MKIVEAQVGYLTNTEVLNVLKDRGADNSSENTPALPSEVQIYESLIELDTPHLTRESLEGFLDELKEFNLSKSEILHLLNFKPESEQLGLCLTDETFERLGVDNLERIIGVVDKYLKPQN